MQQALGSLLSLALLVVSSSAAPAGGDSSKLSRVPTGNTQTKNGVLQVQKVYRKYGWPMPPGLNDAADAAKEKIADSSGVSSGVQKIAQQQNQGTVGSITAIPQQHNSEYLCPIVIGGQSMNLNIDTGSSDL